MNIFPNHFGQKILVARVGAMPRRSRALSEEEVTDAGGIFIDKAAHMVKIDGKEIDLSFLKSLSSWHILWKIRALRCPEKILNNVWNYDYFGDARTIDA